MATALLLEDARSQALTARRVLGFLDNLDQVGSLHEAQRRLADPHYTVDVAFVDLDLPDATGAAIVAALAAQRPDLPLVVLAGGSEGEALEALVHAGAHDLVRRSDIAADVLERAMDRALIHNVTRLAELREEEARTRDRIETAQRAIDGVARRLLSGLARAIAADANPAATRVADPLAMPRIGRAVQQIALGVGDGGVPAPIQLRTLVDAAIHLADHRPRSPLALHNWVPHDIHVQVSPLVAVASLEALFDAWAATMREHERRDAPVLHVHIRQRDGLRLCITAPESQLPAEIERRTFEALLDRLGVIADWSDMDEHMVEIALPECPRPGETADELTHALTAAEPAPSPAAGPPAMISRQEALAAHSEFRDSVLQTG